MSYILDALRKADAQRERDSSRGIHAHPTPPGAGMNNGIRPAWLWGGIGALVAIAVAAVWWMSGSKPFPVTTTQPARQPQSLPSQNPQPPSPQPQYQPAVRPQANHPAPAVMPAPPPVMGGVPPVTNARVITPPAQPRTETPMPARGGMAPPMQATPPQATPPQASTPGVQPPSPAAAPAAVAGLPPDAPRVAISGGVYSPNPAQRMLIVGGQVYNEGSEIAPGLTIDEIKPRTAVLKFRGVRYTVAY